MENVENNWHICHLLRATGLLYLSQLAAKVQRVFAAFSLVKLLIPHNVESF